MNRSKVEIDLLAVHSDDLGEAVGEFYGTPIRQWNASESRKREDADLIQRLDTNRASDERIARETPREVKNNAVSSETVAWQELEEYSGQISA